MANLTDSVCGCPACTLQPRSAEAREHREILRALSGLDEKHARRIVGLLAKREGRGGSALMSRVTGMSRTTILQGQKELGSKDPVPGIRPNWSKVEHDLRGSSPDRP